jgi:hypothetical protein
MKKLLAILFAITLLASIAFVGCSRQTKEEIDEGYHERAVNATKSVAEDALEVGFVTIEWDGCEYLIGGDHRQGLMSHKGNCFNPIHEHNK